MSIRYLSGINVDANTLFVDSANDRVGIGTGSPTGELHIYASQPAFRIQSSVSGNMQFGQWDTTTNRIQSTGRNFYLVGTDSYDTIFATNNAERMRITSDGNVGIGTTAPIDKLHIVGGLTSTSIAAPSNTSIGSLQFGYDGTNGLIRSWNSSPIIYQAYNYQSWETSGSERMRITSAGNVGIGTTSPAGSLDIYGTTGLKVRIGYFTDQGADDPTLRMFDGKGTRPSYSFTSDNTSGMFGGSGFVAFSTSASERMRITSAGNVGIGTTSPATRLDLGSTQGGGIQFLYDSSQVYRNGIYNYWNSGTDTRMDFNIGRTANVAPVTVMSVGYAGNVGIGTTSPTEILELSTTTDPKIRFVDVGNTDAKIGIVGSTALGFEVNGSERMRITAAGDVGIGTTSPATKLQIKGGDILIDAGQWIKGVYSTETIYRPLFGISSDRNTTIIRAADNDAPDGVDIQQYDGTSIAYFKQGGNVGIGTASPSYKLDVTGAARVTSTLLGGGRISAATEYRLNDNSYSRVAIIDGGGAFAGGYNFNINSGTPQHDSTGAVSAYYYNSAGYISFYTNSSQSAGTAASERMRIDASGKVLVNTTTSHGTLTIEQSVSESGLVVNSSTASAPTLYLRDAGGAGYSELLANNKLSINASNVGIGTTSPIQPLTVSAISNANTIALLGRAADNASRIDFYNNAGNSRLYTVALGNSAVEHYADANIPMVFSTNAAERMRITAAGNVGIGTTNPGAILEVKGSYGDNAVKIQNTNSSYYSSIGFVNSSGSLKMAVGVGNPSAGSPYADTAYIYTPSATDFIVSAGASERMRITAAGNVGIGTTSPSAKLHVQGTSYFFDQSIFSDKVGIGTTAPVVKTHIVGPTLTTTSETTYPLWLSDTGDTTKALILGFDLANDVGVIQAVDQAVAWKSVSLAPSGGNVGIGTTSPAYKLSVVGESNFSENIYIGNGSSYGVWTDTAGVRRNGIYLNTSSGYLGIRSGTSSTGEQDRIVINQSTGNVGIGTTSPSYALSVVRNANDWIGQYKNYGSIAYGLQIDLSGSTGATAGYVIGAYSQTGTGFFLKNDGTVGIGTTSPGAKLHVVGTESRFGGVASGYISVYNANSRSGYLQANEGSDFRIASDTNDMTFYVNGSERVRFTAGGNVGIGTTSPTEKLHVDGSALVTYNNSYQSTNSTGGKAILARVSPTSGIVNYAEYATVTNLNGFVIGSDDAQVKGVYASDKLEFITNTATRMAITSGGNVGIGTASPTNILHITGVMRMDNVSANDPTLTNNATPKHGYGDVANEIYLAEPAAWFKINVEGTDYIIPAYLESV